MQKKTYDAILSFKKKGRDIEAASQHNFGFKLFIEEILKLRDSNNS